MSCGACGRWYYTEADEILAPRGATPTLPAGYQQTARGLSRQFSRRPLSDLAASLEGRLLDPDAADPVRLAAVPLDASLTVATCTIEAGLLELTDRGCRLQIDATLKVGFLLLDFSRVGFSGVQALAAVRQLQIDRDAMRIGCQFLTGE